MFFSEAASVMKQDYREIVSKSLSEMIETENLTTVLCFVPNQLEKVFNEKYYYYSGGYVLDDSAL